MELIEITSRPALKFETLTGIHRVEIKRDEELAEEIYMFCAKEGKRNYEFLRKSKTLAY